MRNAFRSKGKTFTNWITNADGSITERPVKVYTVGDGQSGLYELEICSEYLGLMLETDFHGVHTIVKSVDTRHSDKAVQAAVTVGDVLISVNNHVMLYEDFEDIIAYLNTLRDACIPRRLRFLNTAKCPIAVYTERIAFGQRCQDRTDVYGFVRSAEYLKDEYMFMSTNRTTLTQRDQDWITYLKSIGGYVNVKPFAQYRPSAKLKVMVRRGIPAAFRPLLWKHISLSSHYESKFPKDYYSTLLSRIDNQLCPSVQLDISKDVGRTFPDHKVLNSEKGKASLSIVLSALAMHNPEIGYCQSLNFIAGTLLLFLSEEDSFWLLCVITECLLPHDNYSASMTGTYLDQQVFEEVVRQRLPAIDEKLTSFGLQLSLCSIQWFMCLFVNTLRMEPALRVWDIFLNEGDQVLFRIAVGLLKLHEEEILCCSDASTLYMCLKGIGTSLVDADDLVRVSFEETGLADPSGSSSLSAAASKRLGSLYEDIANKSKAVPKRLQGLGLGHIGWTSTPSSVATPHSNDAKPTSGSTPTLTENTSTIATFKSETCANTASPIIPEAQSQKDVESTNGISAASSDFGSSLETDAFVSKPSTESLFTPLRVDTSEWNLHSSLSPSSSCPDEPTKKDNKTLQLKEKRDDPNFYRQFKETELFDLRAKFRPEVEERLLGMKKTRQQWKEDREKKDLAAAMAKSEDQDIGKEQEQEQEQKKEKEVCPNNQAAVTIMTSSDHDDITENDVKDSDAKDGVDDDRDNGVNDKDTNDNFLKDIVSVGEDDDGNRGNHSTPSLSATVAT